ncbi:MAG: Ig-like domain-containing protein, partial [Gemmatimonadaceae bacterium]|nr:Ig-like domain-containing protein [Gemmatimonadaceae bacterium]
TVNITFSEAMDATTVSATNITVRVTSSGTAVTGTVAYNTTTRVATFTPASPLAQSTGYSVTVSTGVKDAAGNALAAPFQFAFSTGDTAAPTIVARTPTNGATGIAINTNVTVTFSEPMNATTINSTNITLTPTAGGSPIAGTVTYNSATNTATLDPTADLANNTSYTITVTTGVKDVAGNALAATSTSTFTTVTDLIAPTVIARTPTDSINVPRDTTITVTFSEDMNASTVNTAFSLAFTGGAAVPGSVVYDSATRTATLTPSGTLSATTSYTATVTTAAKDTAGNGLTGNFSFAFKTGS